MKIEIHWPEKDIEHLNLADTGTGEDSRLLIRILIMSYTHDVIIDRGVITFVDKE